MDNTEKLEKLLRAFIDAVGFDIEPITEHVEGEYEGHMELIDFKLTKRKKQV